MMRPRRQLHALLIEPHHHEKLDAGESITIVRDGHRSYSEGIVILAWYLTSWCRLGMLGKVKHTSLDHIIDEEWKQYGFKSSQDANKFLLNKYPGINFHSNITIIELRVL